MVYGVVCGPYIDLEARPQFQPLRDHILVKHSGLMASRSLQVIWNRDNDQQIWFHGTVKAVGPGKRDKKGNVRPLTVQPGDVVAYGKFQFPKYHEAGEEYLILQEADVVGVVGES
jgi:chaperonin GroES